MSSVELERKTYNLLRKLFSDSRRLIANAKRGENKETRIVLTEDLQRLNETLEAMLMDREEVSAKPN